jgi:dipeptidyl aminopeptidase/acylaminoacyl peptidase
MKEFSPDDLYLHQKITELHAHPTEALAAATVRSVDRDNDQYLSAIWLFSSDQTPRQLTRGPGRDSSPHWAPDGRHLAFTSDRAGGPPQLHLMRRDGGESRPLCPLDKGVSQLGWTPDSKTVLATVPVAAGQEGPAEVCWRLPYKADGVGFLLQREIHLFAIDVASGESTQLTQGAFDVNGFDASPNGKHIAYSRMREGRYAHQSDLWVCDIDGSGHRQLTRDLATVLKPAWSPDGRWIVFGGARKEGDGQTGLWLYEFASGRLLPLGGTDFEVADTENLLWSADSRSLRLVRAHRGRHEVVQLSVPGGEIETLCGGDRQLSAFGGNEGALFFAIDTPVAPSDMHTAAPDGCGERRISDLNAWWQERTPLVLEARSYRVPDGQGGEETIEGWLLRARDREGPGPLLCDAHGGPAAYVLLDYDSNVFWHTLASRGWAISMLNPVGSSSFGREFCERLSGRWGELDLPQHEAALDQLREAGVCDERVAISGKSYGGFFSAWAIGHSDLYRAAIVMAPVGNIETHYGTSDGGYYADPLYIGTAPHFDRGKARELSPLQYIERTVTPTLFVQGKEDERCPKCQSEEMFVSLLRAGDTPAELVLYPGENHLFLSEGKPGVRADASRRIVQWLGRHIGRPVVRKNTAAPGAARSRAVEREAG